MNESLATILRDRLAALPFADPINGARVCGLARLHTGTVNDGDAPRTVKLPVPATWGADACARDARYLVPDEGTPSIWFFEDYGTAPERLSGNLYGNVGTLRLLGWFNPARLSGPLPENDLLQALSKALRLRERHDAGPYRRLLLTATVLPAETALFGRYTYDTETPLLLSPYRLVGLELRAAYLPAPACPPEALPTLVPAAPCPTFS